MIAQNALWHTKDDGHSYIFLKMPITILEFIVTLYVVEVQIWNVTDFVSAANTTFPHPIILDKNMTFPIFAV